MTPLVQGLRAMRVSLRPRVPLGALGVVAFSLLGCSAAPRAPDAVLVSRGCRFLVAPVDASALKFSGDVAWDDARGAADRAALEARLPAGLVEALRAQGVRAARFEPDSSPRGADVLVVALPTEFDRGAAVNPLSRSRLTCRVRFERGPRREPAGELTLVSTAGTGEEGAVTIHVERLLAAFVRDWKELVDE